PIEDCGAIFDEVLVLAVVGGAFVGTDPAIMDSFLERLPEICQRSYPEPQLASEREPFKSTILRHLDVLRRDADVRSRYQRLLLDVWAEVRDTWESEGRSTVEAASSHLR